MLYFLWLNSLRLSDAYMRRQHRPSLVQIFGLLPVWPNHYLNQCEHVVNWTLVKKLQWNFDWNSSIFFKENAFEKVVCQMASILSRPQWVEMRFFFKDHTHMVVVAVWYDMTSPSFHWYFTYWLCTYMVSQVYHHSKFNQHCAIWCLDCSRSWTDTVMTLIFVQGFIGCLW